ncbi:peptidoglycan D,D-transpeptidase FtsI family protein [Chiayiivirga flava]|uniref:Peptidoglycan D,D-transpeptidase FtsI n=1 Tax=Chiayiivirga flava TaxID=659595 RepID=A0A7W8D6G2_9GAMM|nr:penicillin-binding protein 2 [Chiayiivirga flava]MBB5208780.1 cell division protein FtsI (penicillin-binding protein 3) [Chiayiivirga flava]
MRRTRGVNTRARLLAVVAVLGLGATVLIARAVDMQLLNDDFYQQQGDARFLREIEIPTSRGMITDRNGEPLAVSTPVESIWCSPLELLQHTDRLPQLAEAVDIDLDTLTQRLSERADKEFMFLRRHMNPDDADAILELGIPGVFSQREFRRYYPLGEVVAHVLGKTNIDDHGQEGLELAFEDWLSGTPGAKRVIRDRRGRIVENVDLIRAPEPGQALALSIDRRIQYLAYRELKTALTENQAASGSIVVLDVSNGEILAMVNQPSYNPNLREPGDAGSHRNRALTDVFEPGSVMKSFTIAAAIEAGKFTPDTPVPTAPGYISIAGYPIRDFKNYGTLTVSGVLSKSSNVGATKIASTLSNEHQYDMYRRFGLGQASGSGFPGESAGVLPGPNTWGPTEKATISYGYGLNTTLLQLARAYAAIGNGGRLIEPTFVKDANNPSEQIIDPELAQQMLTMLEGVTAPGGTATRANVLGYRVGGKTGTSRKAAGGGYADKKYTAVFVGLVPASQPKFVTAVVIHEPNSFDAAGALVYGGGAVAAPVFHRVMDGALRLMDVQPDNVQQWYAAAPAPTDPTAEQVPDSDPMPEAIGVPTAAASAPGATP